MDFLIYPCKYELDGKILLNVSKVINICHYQYHTPRLLDFTIY